MWQIFTVVIIYMIKIMIYILLASFKLAGGLLKWEGRAIKASYRRYPIGFISFFFHLIGFWTTMLFAEGLHSEFLYRIYTFGLCENMKSYIDIVMLPMGIVMYTNGESDILMIICVLLMFFLCVPAFILTLELVFVLFPVLYAILTQLILGIPLHAFVSRWREKYDVKEREELGYENGEIVRSKECTSSLHRNPSVSNRGMSKIQIGPDTMTEDGLKVSSVTIKENKGQQYREFDETYHNVKKRIDDRTFKLYHLHEQLIKKKGPNDSLEKMYAQTISMHNEMQMVYKRAYDTVCFTNDYEAIKECYAELKKEMIRVKNAQANLTEAIKKAYGVQV